MSDPRVRSDMYSDLKSLRSTIQKKYPGGDFIVSSAKRTSSNMSGHNFGLGVDIKPTGSLTWSQLNDVIRNDYKDTFHPVMHNNMTPGSGTTIKYYNPDNYNKTYSSSDNFHIDVKYKKYSTYDKFKNNTQLENKSAALENTGLSNSTSYVNQANPQPQINPDLVNLEYFKNLPTPDPGSLGSVIFGAIANVGLSALTNFGVGKVLDKLSVTKSVHAQILNAPSYHSGGQVPGQGEMLAVLKGGETVRTKAQEDELQQSLYEKYAESYAPLVCGGRDDSNKESGQNTSQNKPIHQQITKDDEVFILSLISDALERNRMGLRNQVKAA